MTTEIVASMRHPRWLVGLGEPRRHFKKFRKDANTTDWYMHSSMNRWNAPILGDAWEIDALSRFQWPRGGTIGGPGNCGIAQVEPDDSDL